MKPDLGKTNSIVHGATMSATAYAGFAIDCLTKIQGHFAHANKGNGWPNFWGIKEEFGWLKNFIETLEVAIDRGNIELEEYKEAALQENKRISEGKSGTVYSAQHIMGKKENE
jgi:hypothetical protein